MEETLRQQSRGSLQDQQQREDANKCILAWSREKEYLPIIVAVRYEESVWLWTINPITNQECFVARAMQLAIHP